jgi:hypothetical protein
MVMRRLEPCWLALLAIPSWTSFRRRDQRTRKSLTSFRNRDPSPPRRLKPSLQPEVLD